jgi:hypothetical protein
MVGAVPPVADDDAEVIVAGIESGIEADGVAVGAVVKAGVGGGD